MTQKNAHKSIHLKYLQKSPNPHISKRLDNSIIIPTHNFSFYGNQFVNVNENSLMFNSYHICVSLAFS